MQRASNSLRGCGHVLKTWWASLAFTLPLPPSLHCTTMPTTEPKSRGAAVADAMADSEALTDLKSLQQRLTGSVGTTSGVKWPVFMVGVFGLGALSMGISLYYKSLRTTAARLGQLKPERTAAEAFAAARGEVLPAGRLPPAAQAALEARVYKWCDLHSRHKSRHPYLYLR